MTGSGVERLVRTPSLDVVPVAAATPPSPSRVTGRPGRRARGLRWGLRTLVVGGIAGAAWLFSGAAAHAADHPATAEAPSSGLSVVSLVNGLGTGADERATSGAAATGIVRDGAQRLTGVAGAGTKAASDAPASQRTGPNSDRPARQPAGVAGLTVSITDLVPASPAPHVTEQVLTAGNGVEGLVKVLAAPFRLTDGPARTPGALGSLPTTEPIVAGLRPLTDLLQSAADPAAAASAPDADLSAVSFAPAPTSHSPAGKALSADGATAPPLAPAEFLRAGERATGGASLLALQRFAAAHLPDTLTAATGADGAPNRPEPAPMHGHGAVGGAPSAGSGAPSEGGSSATVPSSVVGDAEAGLRLPAATSVEVRRHDAEAPTVSPD